MEILWHVSQQTFGIKEAGNSFQHVSNSYFLKENTTTWVTSDAITTVSHKYPIITKYVAVISWLGFDTVLSAFLI